MKNDKAELLKHCLKLFKEDPDKLNDILESIDHSLSSFSSKALPEISSELVS